MSGEQKKGFDLAGLMKHVSNLNTQPMQIENLPFHLLDPDPNNFYSLEGLNELADSIATVGLVHPLRVRQTGERYTITSGHRRRAAIQLLIDSGDEQWKDAVPCIVDHGDETPEFTELKLIFANNQRQKTSAELSKEAARVEELLYKLQEQGYEFPGRMRDHVAAAVNVTASKLARLHAIRSNLVPEMLTLFDAGEVNEACAYELQKLPARVQRYLVQQKNIGPKMRAYGIREVQQNLDAYLHPNCKCPNGEACTHTYPRIKQTVISAWECTGECCLKCHRRSSDCPYRCKQSKDALASEKEDRKASAERAKAKEAKMLEENRAVLTGKYIALDILAADKKIPDDTAVSIPGCRTIADLHDRARGKGISDFMARNASVFGEYTYLRYATETADLLGASVDFLLGRTKEPEVNRGEAERTAGAGSPSSGADAPPSPEGEGIVPQWQTGEPPREGRYFCKVRSNADDDDEPPKEFRFDWDGEQWYFSGRPILKGMIVAGWWPLPEV